MITKVQHLNRKQNQINISMIHQKEKREITNFRETEKPTWDLL